jgi:outer membrane protein assembly factor BamE (lipoprotein component of BamABCDE complex)
MVICAMRTTALGKHALCLTTALVLGAAAGLTGCTSYTDYRGYLPRQEDVQKLQAGMTKTEVEALLGSPSTTATVNFTGDSYYYISSVIEERGFLDPQEVDRRILAVRFDQTDRVQSFGNYGLEDGQIVDFNTRKTPTRGREFTILQQLFQNLGRFTPNNKPPGRGRIGGPAPQ